MKKITILLCFAVAALSCTKQDNPHVANMAKVTGSNFISLAQADSDVHEYGSLYGYSFSQEDVVAYATSNPAISRVQLIFGKRNGQLVLNLLALDVDGKVVTTGGNVLDHANPCPANCPLVDANGNFVEHQ